MDVLLVLLVMAVIVILLSVYTAVRERFGGPAGRGNARDLRSEAYFKAMFPELQPHFHPEKLVKFVRDRNGRKSVGDGYRWNPPPGFLTAAAVVATVAGRERIRLLDAAGAPLVEFDYEQAPTGAAMRVGRGKLTTVLDEQHNPRVRYWHPEREFKWSRKGGWKFTTPMADKEIDSDNSGSRFSSDTCRSSSTGSYVAGAAAAGAAAAMVSGAGGAFAGGGASGDWDGAAAAGSEGDSGGGATAY